MGVGSSGARPRNQGTPKRFVRAGLMRQIFFLRSMRQRDWRGEREGRTNDSRSFDEVACVAEIVFSSQVCAFISSRDMVNNIHAI
jgi:hypothetical protein